MTIRKELYRVSWGVLLEENSHQDCCHNKTKGVESFNIFWMECRVCNSHILMKLKDRGMWKRRYACYQKQNEKNPMLILPHHSLQCHTACKQIKASQPLHNSFVKR